MKIYHFTADWCNPCKHLKPIIEEYLLEHPEVEYRMINVDTEISITRDMEIQSVPTLIVMDGLDMISRQSGLVTKKELEKLFNKE